MHRAGLQQKTSGRVLAKELSVDESGDRIQLVIDGTDGRVHQVELRADRRLLVSQFSFSDVLSGQLPKTAAKTACS